MILALAAMVLAFAPSQLPPLPELPPLPPIPTPCLPEPLPPVCPPPEPPPPWDDPPKFTGSLAATKAAGWIRLTWKPATDDQALAGYRFYRDGIYIGRRGAGATTTRLRLPCGRHRYRVEAVDSAGQAASATTRVRRKC